MPVRQPKKGQAVRKTDGFPVGSMKLAPADATAVRKTPPPSQAYMNPIHRIWDKMNKADSINMERKKGPNFLGIPLPKKKKKQ